MRGIFSEGSAGVVRKGYPHRWLSGCAGGGFRFGVGEWRGLLVRNALVSALVCVCAAVTWWFRACLLCLPWLSCVSCVAAFGCDAVSCDFV